MYDPEHILQILETRMAELGISQQELGFRAFGKASNSAIQDLKKGSSPSLERVRRMADALDLEVYFGPRRNRNAVVPAPMAGLSEGGDNDSRVLPWFEPRLGQDSPPVRFSLSWLQSVDLVIENLRALIPDQVECPSFLGKNCLALIEDPSRPGPDPTWWAFRENTRVIIARLQCTNDVHVILPGGPESAARVYGPSDFAFRPLGKVVWLSVVRPS